MVEEAGGAKEMRASSFGLIVSRMDRPVLHPQQLMEAFTIQIGIHLDNDA